MSVHDVFRIIIDGNLDEFKNIFDIRRSYRITEDLNNIYFKRVEVIDYTIDTFSFVFFYLCALLNDRRDITDYILEMSTEKNNYWYFNDILIPTILRILNRIDNDIIERDFFSILDYKFNPGYIYLLNKKLRLIQYMKFKGDWYLPSFEINMSKTVFDFVLSQVNKRDAIRFINKKDSEGRNLLFKIKKLEHLKNILFSLDNIDIYCEDKYGMNLLTYNILCRCECEDLMFYLFTYMNFSPNISKGFNLAVTAKRLKLLEGYEGYREFLGTNRELLLSMQNCKSLRKLLRNA